MVVTFVLVVVQAILGVSVVAALRLVSLYRSSRKAGYLLVAGALCLWPALSAVYAALFHQMLDQLATGRNQFPVSLVFGPVIEGRMTIGEIGSLTMIVIQVVQMILILLGVRLSYGRGDAATEQQYSIQGGDNRQLGRVTKATRSIGFGLVVLGLLLAFAVPAMLTQQAESSANNVSMGGSAAGASFEGVLRGEIRTRARQNGDEVRNFGFMVVIGGAAVVALTRSATAMGFLAKQQTKR